MVDRLRFERSLSSPNEVFDPSGEPFSHYQPVLEEMGRMGPGEWKRRTHRAQRGRLEQQRALGMVPDDEVHPTDYVPRILPAADWAVLEQGLAQRMLAINEWLRRLEAGRDEIVPVERSGRNGEWEYLVIEDNAKMPVGIEPMNILRTSTPDVLPESYTTLRVRPLDGLMERLGEVVRAASPRPDPTMAILSTGPHDQYYLDHKVFASELGAILAERHEVELDRDGRLVHKESGRRIDIIYERIEDGRIYDDITGLIESQARGLIDAVFAPNLGIADDKGVYPFIPEMIRTYLEE